uniref:Uncharacterized protein n=1 Tax=Arundo donax TaxID=35708 RepID=A0A0A9CQL8_ARUDO
MERQWFPSPSMRLIVQKQIAQIVHVLKKPWRELRKMSINYHLIRMIIILRLIFL